MKTDLASFVSSLPVFDVHEHHMPVHLLDREVGLLQLLTQSYCGWTRKLPYALPLGPPPTADAAPECPGTWEDVSWFVNECGTNAFVRNMVHALIELYGLDDAGITEGNWLALDTEIRARHADPAWNGTVLDRAGVRTVLTDPYLDPLLDLVRSWGTGTIRCFG